LLSRPDCGLLTFEYLPVVRKFWLVGAAVLLLAGALVSYRTWQKGEPRREALATLHRLEAALTTGTADTLLQIVRLPAATRQKTEVEQVAFLRRVLGEEISSEGLLRLKRDGEFGPLLALFPDDGSRWAAQGGVNPQECVAFKLERVGLRTEVVLHKDGSQHRLVRCNNVRQLAAVAKP
jgi:hypothetical protein